MLRELSVGGPAILGVLVATELGTASAVVTEAFRHDGGKVREAFLREAAVQEAEVGEDTVQ